MTFGECVSCLCPDHQPVRVCIHRIWPIALFKDWLPPLPQLPLLYIFLIVCVLKQRDTDLFPQQTLDAVHLKSSEKWAITHSIPYTVFDLFSRWKKGGASCPPALLLWRCRYTCTWRTFITGHVDTMTVKPISAPAPSRACWFRTIVFGWTALSLAGTQPAQLSHRRLWFISLSAACTDSYTHTQPTTHAST